ncbi:MAG: hypothetical protein FWE54_05560 [Methanimicrococcus sp.]|nr:hypothetical protein [Methanimicrococcus sp.]
MTSDDNVKKIARFLENGGTMLANHCESCGAPLFRFKGEIVCPLCSGVETSGAPAPVPAPAPISKDVAPVFCSPGVPAKKSDAPQKYTGQKKKKEPEPAAVRGTIERTVYSADEERLKELILRKVTEVAEDMQNETDPRRIYENLELIEKGLDIIERLY